MKDLNGYTTNKKEYQIKPRIKRYGTGGVLFVAVGHPYYDGLDMEGDWHVPCMNEALQFSGIESADWENGLDKCNWLQVLVLTGLSKQKVHRIFKRYLRKQRARCRGKY